ncbi:atp synthase f0 subunit a : ATP synthase subunit a OS=Singulisphaera acidiphila (strain ATCC BAA-1392 / DSM 18658 / VKM B-2454 / MOB10) GN=atpB PE=3 SV=1: ATP-synt_A [Tuwongella immobilis]|uniref:ATP synthase subunit a n=2 Tax=Tuwongella immobilis TaxID=692036 RepID=A0A6C2YPZ6_9BACT|nr:atp synthase f0 subunit a : ATP synthase subunit a OS=Singulisphaera acidiphila (strain ATCC BAA-1392 / DSM 18658 / VKM B-2454 / MOB10) GN=atpB PE=3 SV=1: ATP-synt_A [Tuwongella immobilis]VTS04300.1 atp synthase f0 subunit a : ATP synthase subunit a OS=Singulisphaera acidiphila (strain ATCC BAA-1392 / DSM 18658 / VKM B-2454 / MOB10) GN=atpB PE=3 SV=1: ATP-synt_A [Tuwongella immobilis]
MATEKIDPFHHVIDGDIEIFDSTHAIVHLPNWFNRFHLEMAIAAVLLVLVFVTVAQFLKKGKIPRGRLLNAFEFLLLFIRDQVAKPTIGEHDYKRYLPFLWTLFLFILAMNMLGMIPFMGTATASIYVTGALALIAFGVIHGGGVKEHGWGGYIKTFKPHIEANDKVTAAIAPTISIGLFFLEIFSAFVRGFVLAARLFANMLAGHTVLFVMLLFIKMAGNASMGFVSESTSTWLFWLVTPFSVVLSTLMSVLELFVAFLQAFVFTFLTSIFIGLALHPEH